MAGYTANADLADNGGVRRRKAADWAGVLTWAVAGVPAAASLGSGRAGFEGHPVVFWGAFSGRRGVRRRHSTWWGTVSIGGLVAQASRHSSSLSWVGAARGSAPPTRGRAVAAPSSDAPGASRGWSCNSRPPRGDAGARGFHAREAFLRVGALELSRCSRSAPRGSRRASRPPARSSRESTESSSPPRSSSPTATPGRASPHRSRAPTPSAIT